MIPGPVATEEVRQNLAWMRRDIPDALWAELKGEGLIRRGCADAALAPVELTAVVLRLSYSAASRTGDGPSSTGRPSARRIDL